MSDSLPVPAVYGCNAAVSAEIAKAGISKGRKNEQQHYSFRGIDDVYNALAPILAAKGLVIIPRILSRACVERTSKSGTLQFFVTVEAEFDFIAAIDGSRVTARTYGEAQDTADKSTNKAMSAAYKYLAMMTFCIPTEGDNDADAKTPEASVATAPTGFEDWLLDMAATAENGTPALRDAWKGSSKAFRDHLAATDKSQIERLRARAAQATQATQATQAAEALAHGGGVTASAPQMRMTPSELPALKTASDIVFTQVNR